MKLIAIKTYNTVKVNGRESLFFSQRDYNITLLDNNLVSIEQRGDITYTSLANTAWFKLEQGKTIEQAASKKDTERVSKKKAK